MEKKSTLPAILAALILATSAPARPELTPPELVAAAPEKGFEFPYFIRVPAADDAVRTLLVEPNNTGKVDDDPAVHVEAAKRLASSAIGADVAERLDLPLLVPAFPRPLTGWERYTHALDGDTLRIEEGPMKRLDLQLLAMIADARSRLASRGIATGEKVALTGFSASGSFVNRFTALHPDEVAAVAGGGLNAVLLVPATVAAGGLELPFPIGVADLASRAGKPFDLEAWKRVPQLYYMGAKDDNDAVQYDDAYSPAEKAIVDHVLGASMQPARWERCQAIYREAGANVTFVTWEHAGHFTDERMNAAIADWFRERLTSPAKR
jgi:hypothetical protein